MASAVRVVVHGATGRMGREVAAALVREDDMEPVGAVARSDGPAEYQLPDDGAHAIPYDRDLAALLQRIQADVVVDFSSRDGALTAARACATHKTCLVTGASGLSPEDVASMDQLARDAEIGIVVGPNFSLGAVILLHLAERAARHFDYAEIIELHHAGKADAPSGSALATARALVAARDNKPFTHPEPRVEPLQGTRGGELGGVSLHAIRLPGLMAHQELIFGGPGETLTLRHDTINRECYMPGVLLAVRKVREAIGVTYGLGALLGLD